MCSVPQLSASPKVTDNSVPPPLALQRLAHCAPLPPLTLCIFMAGMADLSFEAESPVMPPDELLEGLPSYDWLLQGHGESAEGHGYYSFFQGLLLVGGW